MKASGYLAVLRKHQAFRNIWLSALVSQAGDWFTLIALYSLLAEYVGTGESVGLMLAARFLPPALVGPVAGVVADRFPRKTVMICCDLLRAATVLGFLLVQSKEDVWLVYLLTFLQMTFSAFFEPAEQAAIGATVPREDVVTANTIHAATWAAMMSLGAIAGGLVTTLFSRDAAFITDGCSYLLSALFILRAQIPKLAKVEVRTGSVAEFLEGLKLVASDAGVRRAVFVKTGWSIAGGGAILVYAIFGERVFPIAGSTTAGIGVLLGMRGLGALLGPIVARRYGGDGLTFLERAITASYVVTIVFYVAFAAAPNLPIAALMLAVAHTGISTQWTFSSALINLQVPDRLRGRVFSIDFMAYTLTMATSSVVTGWLIDHSGASERQVMAGLGVVLVIPLLSWLWMGRARQVPVLNP